ncbi:hypothetical protein MRY87_12065 [bacterium]|nr:hypothetical protein [bacterium]
MFRLSGQSVRFRSRNNLLSARLWVLCVLAGPFFPSADRCHALPLAAAHGARAEQARETAPQDSVSRRIRRFVPARVHKATYRRERSTLGKWRGRVYGTGKTHLFLRFLKNKQVIGKRLIGRVKLENEKDGVLFSYRGTIPQQRSLRWDIVAFSERY